MPEPQLDDYASKYSYVKFKREDGILEMQLHSDGEDLVWGFEPHEELGYCFADVAADPENEVIILTGTGEAFIGDEEIGEVSQVGPDAWKQVIEEAQRLVFNQLRIPAPMIAAINGPARVHAEIGLFCDIVLASEDTVFQDKPHFEEGLVPGDSVQVIWPMLLGLNRGRYFLLTGEEISAQEALDLGVVNEVMSKDELLPRAWELAREIKQRPDLTVRFTRQGMIKELKRRLQNDLVEGLALEGLGVVSEWPYGK